MRIGADSPSRPAVPELSITLPGGLIAHGADVIALAALVHARLVRVYGLSAANRISFQLAHFRRLAGQVGALRGGKVNHRPGVS